MMTLIGSIIFFIGAVFLLLASIGILRMPDIYTRIQTGTKATTLGLILILVGMSFYHPEWGWKLLILGFFVLLTNPVSSHAIAKSAHQCGIPLTPETVEDDLETQEQDNNKGDIPC